MSASQDQLENVAMLTSMIDWEQINSKKFQGKIAILEIVIESARSFTVFHDQAASGDCDYWDGVDWYEATEQWFDEVLAPEIYENAIDSVPLQRPHPF